MNQIFPSSIISETRYAYLVKTLIDSDKNWTCWIPKNILSKDLHLLEEKGNTVLIAKKSLKDRTRGSASEVHILAKYLMRLII